MKREFGTVHARTFCHATEDLEKVQTAMKNVLGNLEIMVSRTEGVHGNSIFVLEAESDETESIAYFVSRLAREDLEDIVHGLDSRIDEKCNLFLRLDKQRAYMGDIKLGKGDDVISVRFHVFVFPARRSVASDTMREFLSRELTRRD